MRIALTVTLDLDPQVWADEYGIDPGPGTLSDAVRADVRSHLANTVHEHYVSALGVATDATVTVRPGRRTSPVLPR